MILKILEKVDAEEVFGPFFKLYESLPEEEKEGYLKESFDSAVELFHLCKMNDEGLFNEVVVFSHDDKDSGAEKEFDKRLGFATKKLGIDEVFAVDALEEYMVIS